MIEMNRGRGTHRGVCNVFLDINLISNRRINNLFHFVYSTRVIEDWDRQKWLVRNLHHRLQIKYLWSSRREDSQ